jgi:DNA helicase HerA-like ATPase
MLEQFKTKRDQGEETPLDAVVVFVDELNKFAPSGRSFGHGLKEQITEIAARGRSVGLILFGAEQFASGIDKEVYGNCSTHFVGRTEHVELTDSVYRWISRDLMYVASTLSKGFLLCKHALFARPLLLRFPKPLNT